MTATLGRLPDDRRLRKRVALAGVLAAASVIACIVVLLDGQQRASDGGRTVLYDLRRAPGVAPSPGPTPTVTAPPRPTAPSDSLSGDSDEGRSRRRHGEPGRRRRRAGATDSQEPSPEEAPATERGAAPPPSPPPPVAHTVLRELPPAEAELPPRLSSAQMEGVLRAARDRVARCTRGRTERVAVAVSVGSDGVPNVVSVAGLAYDDVARFCVEGVLRSLRFPRSQEGWARFRFLYRVASARR